MRQLLSATGFILLGLIFAGGCRQADEPPAQEKPGGADIEARKPPEFDKTPAGDKVDMNQLMAQAMQKEQANLPPGHPPIGTMPSDDSAMPAMPPGHPPIGTMPAGMVSGTTLPAGHPPIGGQSGPVAFSGDMAPPEQSLAMNPPKSWTAKPARPMTVAVYDLPKPADAPAGAELTISHYPGMKNIPLDMQVKRWAGQFAQPEGANPADAVKQSKLENTNHPTTLVDITGTYQGGSMMMGAPDAPKDNYRMMVAVVDTDQGPWFFRLIGPKATLAAHEEEFKKFVREAK